jgi:LysM repeat protein
VGGDTLQKIAQKLLGDANHWKLIFEAHRTLLRGNPNLIMPGWKLTISQSPLDCGGTTTQGMQARVAHLESTTRNTTVVLQDATAI